jgi:heme/copper-type cytochrome/quinol oxidase subunit 3
MNTRHALDISKLPHSVLDHRSTVWWGNALLVIIETVMFAILVGAYFYLKQNFTQWPPPQSNTVPANFDPVPALGCATANLAVIVLSFVPMYAADRGALHRRRRVVDFGLVIAVLMGIAAITLRFYEMHGLKFRWSENAYGSITWLILGLHLMHLFIGTLENLLMLVWVMLKGLDDKHARDVRVTAVYWYWVIGTWIILYAIVMVGPRYF